MPLEFTQGSTALLSAQFSMQSGAPVNVPDATVTIIGAGGDEILEPSPMGGPIIEGFYYYDYVIPNSLPTGNYVVRYSGTVLGVAAVTTDSMVVLPAGSPAAGLTIRQVELIAALEIYLKCAQAIPVYREKPRISYDKTVAQFAWPKWNLTNVAVFKNGELIQDGYSINFDTGTITFESPLHETDDVFGSYNFRWFSDIELLRFLKDALGQMNIQAPGTTFTLDTVPEPFVSVLMLGGSKNAIKALLGCLIFQEPATVFGSRAEQAMSQLQSLKENNEKEFETEKVQVKRAQYPKIAAVVQPEYTLPGGRSRWFRYLYSSGV